MAAGDAPLFALPGASRAPIFARPPSPISSILTTNRPVVPYTPAPPHPTGFGQIWSGISDAAGSLPTAFGNLAGQAIETLPHLGFGPMLADYLRNPDTFKEQDPGRFLQQKLPLAETFRQGFGETYQDIKHPTEYAKAWQQGQIVPKVLNDVANAAIIAGPVAKALTVASGPEALAADAAAAPEARVAAQTAAAEGAAPTATKVATTATRAPFFQAWDASPAKLTAEQVARPSFLRAAQAVESAVKPLETVGFSPARVWTAPIKGVTGFDLPFLRNAEDQPIRVGVRPLLQATGAEDAIRGIPAVQNLEQRIGDWQQNRALVNRAYDVGIAPQNAEAAGLLNRTRRFFQKSQAILGHDPELDTAATMIRTNAAALGPFPGALRDTLERNTDLTPEQVDAHVKDFTAKTFGDSPAVTPRVLQIATDWANGKDTPELAQISEAIPFRSKPIGEAEQVKVDQGVASGMVGHGLSPEQVDPNVTAMESKLREHLAPAAEKVATAEKEVEQLRNARPAQAPMFPQTEWQSPIAPVAAEGEPFTRGERASKDQAMAAVRDQALEHRNYAAERVAEALGGNRIGASLADISAQADHPLQPWEEKLLEPWIDQQPRSGRGSLFDTGAAVTERTGTTPDQWAQHLEEGSGSQLENAWDVPRAINEVINRLADERAASELARGRRVAPELLARYTADLSPAQFDLASTAGAERLQMHREAMRAENEQYRNDFLPELTDLPRPHTLTTDEYQAEMGQVTTTLARAAGVDPEQWTPEERQAFQRLQELQPQAIQNLDGTPLTPDESLARLREVAGAYGEQIPKEAAAAAEAPGLSEAQSWLSTARKDYAAKEAWLREGPKETAPGRAFPVLAGMERARSAWTEMAADIDTISPGSGAKILADMPEIVDTMNQLKARGWNPEYVPGRSELDVGKGRGPVTKEQIGVERKGPGQRAKRFGTITMSARKELQGYADDLRAITQTKAARALDADMGSSVREDLTTAFADGKLVGAHGEPLSQVEFDALVAGKYGPEALAAALDRTDKAAWNPTSPQSSVAPRDVTLDTRTLPKVVHEHYQRWWSPRGNNPIMRGYDFVTRGFKHNVLAMSPRWHVWNILGNSFMATFGAGESPAAIIRGIQEARGLRKIEQDTGEAQTPWRLHSAGEAATMATRREPATWFGRAINKSYAFNETVDDLMHSAVYLAKKAKGYTDEEAVHLSLRAMGDFSRMSPFERDYVRRVIPFYAWARHVTQATFRLTAEHPFRVAWLMNLGNTFGANDQNLPDWLRGAQRLPGANWFLNIGAANPYEGSVGSLWNDPQDLPSQLGKSLNPVLKNAAATFAGWDVSNMQPISRPPGTGNLDVYGTQVPTPMFGDPASWLQFTSRQVPAGKLFHDIADTRFFTRPSYSLYDTGDVEKFRGQPRELQGGLPSQLFHLGGDLGIPFLPSYYDEQQGNARIFKGQRAALTARRRYFG